MSYANTESIILKLGGNNTVLCSKSLLQESEIFKDMMFFGTSSKEPIKLPPFVTENILSFSSPSPSQTAQTTDRGDGRRTDAHVEPMLNVLMILRPK